MPKPDHEPRTWCPQCGAVCTTTTEEGWTTFHHIKEPTIGTYTEEEIIKVFAERKRFRAALEQIANPNPNALAHHTIARLALEG